MATTEPDFSAEAPSFQLGDIYYTLFRHKWKIILTSLVGFAIAAAYYKTNPPPYVSDAKLFIRYIVKDGGKTGAPGRDEPVTVSLAEKGETIIKSEIEILTSADLAMEVVKSIGPEKIIPNAKGPVDPRYAAIIVQQGLLAEVAPSSNVIRVAFAHSDPIIAQQVLIGIVEAYIKKHSEIHRAHGLVNDFLTQETDDLRRRLSNTEEELRKTTHDAGVISLEDAKKAFGEQIAHIRQEIFDSQADLAEKTSIVQDLTKNSSSGATQPGEGEPALVPNEQIIAYQKIATRLASYAKREQDLLGGGFAEESTRVKEVRARIAESEEQKKKLEKDFPGLTRIQVAVPTAPNQGTVVLNPAATATQITALQAKIKTLNGQLAEVRAEAAKVDLQETAILELRRRKELEDANYRYYAANLEQSRINEALGGNRVSNISQIETPTPAVKVSTKTKKVLAGIIGAGIMGGLGWAFLIELYFDRSVRRPADIERTLRLPLFLSIPRLKGLTDPGALPPGTNRLQLTGSGGNRKESESDAELAVVSSESQMALNPFYETLRDRLISYFDTLNVRHKPKLVAVTGVGKDTGVTTLAAGLARSFSETGEGNVLLVDMTQGQGSAQHFHKGATVVGLEQLLDTKQSAQVQDNLYVVSENSNSDRLAKGMPQRFNQLIPKLKASDFDYIIFDMPPVNQISVTPRLASFMDMMLMVIESEKTDREIALHASAMLAKSKTPVGVVLNKTKSYIPSALHQDRESLLGG